jgi:hypothetical protein
MKFFFPDAQDLVDPSFDFATEQRSPHRLRHRDDHYAHEVFPEPPYDGMLISKAIVEGKGGESGRYTMAQRQRLLRVGAREYFRLDGRPLQLMGDCGAFSYVNEPDPPTTVDEVIDFYEACRVDAGASVDHIILAYRPELDGPPKPTLFGDGADEPGGLREWRRRQEITLALAADFRRRHKARKCRFTPVGVAQGWSPRSYAACVQPLQKMGYARIALGGMVPLKTTEILDCVAAAAAVRKPKTEFHLFGVTRLDVIEPLAQFGVTSFDSTSPLRQAFKDDRDNYYAAGRTYTAVRVPQVEGNPKLGRLIAAGAVSQDAARGLERACLTALTGYDRRERPLDDVLDLLRDYALLAGETRDWTAAYRATLGDRPWDQCPCAVCRQLGVHVVLFRGAERNRRRGFHNLHVTYRRLQNGLAVTAAAAAAPANRVRTKG